MGNSNSGRGGLPREKRREVERLIRLGKKNAHIARDCGIDVSTVSRYKRRLRKSRERAAGSGEQEVQEIGTETVRCGGCGGQILVQGDVQCLACLLNKTFVAEARRRRIERITRSRRNQKARLAA